MSEGTAGTGSALAGELPACYRHPREPASALCVNCGRPVCGACAARIGYRYYCPECCRQAAPYRVPPAAPYVVPPPPPVVLGERDTRWMRADWGLLEVFIALFIVFGFYSLVSLALLLATDNPLFYNTLSYGLVFCPLIALSAWAILRRHQRGVRELGLKLDNPGRTLLAGGVGSLAAMVASYGALGIILLLFYLIAGRAPGVTETEAVRSVSGLEVFLVVFTVVVLAPVFEELFFRGLLYPALRNRIGPKAAVVLDGFIFGVLHFQPLFTISLILVGIILAYLYERTESLVAPMLAHALYNGIVILITLLMGWSLY